MTEENLIDIEGAGGGKGGGGGGSEAPNTLRSLNTVRVLEVISEGECEGLVDGAQGILFNNTPLQNPDGSFNFKNVSWSERVGLPDQPYMEGFPSASADYAVGTPVTQANPKIYTVTGPTIDAVSVSLIWPQGLRALTADGDINGTSVDIAFDVRAQGGVWAEVMTRKIEGKTNSAYQRSFRIEKPSSIELGIWELRVRRVSFDAVDSKQIDGFTFSIATEIQDVKLTYPYTAYVGIGIDADSFSSIPSRAYRYRGIKCKVPVNYDPVAATYVGIWNGQFKSAWTDNPAWILYDIITNTRYGLGEVISESELDRYSFYDAGVYNDQLVPDGKGGQERRYTFNTVIASQEPALKVIQSIASAMGATLIRSPLGYQINQDRPSSPVKIINNTNVIDGQFTYRSTPLQERHTVARVTYNDKNDRYLRATTTVEADPEFISAYGWNATEIAAYGATTEGQAIRAGKWLLETELNQKEQVLWKSSFQQFDLQIGDIVTVYDNDYANHVGAGRLLAVTNKSGNTWSIKLDRQVTLSSTAGTVKFKLANGTFNEGSISPTSLGQTTDLIDINVISGNAPTAGFEFIVQQDISGRQVKIMRVTLDPENPAVVEIEGLTHDPNKYSRVELGIDIEPPIYQDSGDTIIGDVTNIRFQVAARVTDEGIRRNLLVSWEPPFNKLFGWFKFQYRKNNGNYVTIDRLSTPVFEIENITDGTYDVIVTCYTKAGLGSNGAKATFSYSLEAVGDSPLHQPTNLHVLGKVGTDFDTADLTIEFTNPLSNSSVSSTLKDFQVTIRDDLNNLLRTENVARVEPGQQQTYTYSYGNNSNDGGPRRSVKVTVQARDTDNKLSGATTSTFVNPVPLAPIIQASSNVRMIQVDVIDTGYEPDIQGIVVVSSKNPGDLMTEAGRIQNIVYKGPGYFYQIQTEDTETRYICAAFYDSFGDTGLNYSAIQVVKPGSTAGIPSGTVLPDSPVDDKYAFWLISDDPDLVGLYGWTDAYGWHRLEDLLDGSVTAGKLSSGISAVEIFSVLPTTDNYEGRIVYLSTDNKLYRFDGGAWIKAVDGADISANTITGNKLVVGTITSAEIATDAITTDKLAANSVVAGKIAAGSVSASKMAVNDLSAISANMGNLTSGTITLDAGGYIRGGALSYGIGTGIWQGYHDGNFKWRVGTPGHAGASWDGTNFVIYGQDGSITLQSGQSLAADWLNLLNKPTTLSAISSAEGTKLAGIAAGATVGAPAGTLVAGVDASNLVTSYTNFNSSNDQNSTPITAPTILADGTAVDHVINTDSSADISFEWTWGGNEADIDGFLVYVYVTTSSSVYAFGTNPAAETVYTVAAAKRAFILFGQPANKYYTFGVRAYRRVDKNISTSGIIQSSLVKTSISSENPYRPTSSVAFSGDITGTIQTYNGALAAGNVNVWGAIAGAGRPQDYATFGATVGTNLYQGTTLINTVVSDQTKITAGNISTFMTAAAIGQAYIGTAAVGTAQIQDLSVVTGKFVDLSVGGRKIASPVSGSVYIGADGVSGVYHGMNRKANVVVAKITPVGATISQVATVYGNYDNYFEILNQCYDMTWQNIGGDTYAFVRTPRPATVEYFYL